MNPWQGDPYRAAMGKARETSRKPLLVVTPGGMPQAERQTYLDSGIDVFTDTDILLEAIGALMTPPPEPIPDSAHAASPTPPARQLRPARQLTEPESLRLLADLASAPCRRMECDSAADAIAAATRLGYPVVLKGVAEGVAHKSDLGLVHVGLRDPDAVAQAYAAVGCPQVIVQTMISGSLEAIAGVTRADGVGLVLIAGLGGIFAEALHDVATFPLPASRELYRDRTGERHDRPHPRQPTLETPRRSLSAFVDLLMALQAAALSLGDKLQRSTSTRSSWAQPAPSPSMRSSSPNPAQPHEIRCHLPRPLRPSVRGGTS